MDRARLNAHVAAFWVDDTRAVGADETRLRLALESIHDLFGEGENRPAFERWGSN